MAIKLQFDTVIVPRAHFARCKDLPAFLNEPRPDGGIVFEINWYDRYLWCETAMSDSLDIVAEWEGRGLASGMPPRTDNRTERARWAWKDLCVAASGSGPYGGGDWLEFDPAELRMAQGNRKGARYRRSRTVPAGRQKARSAVRQGGTPLHRDVRRLLSQG
jgi:hypothetical protein